MGDHPVAEFHVGGVAQLRHGEIVPLIWMTATSVCVSEPTRLAGE